MSVRIQNHTIRCSQGDELGLGSISFFGPIALISEDPRPEADHGFFPEMKEEILSHMRREHPFIWVFFVSYDVYTWCKRSHGKLRKWNKKVHRLLARRG